MSTDTETGFSDCCDASACETPVDEDGAIIYGREGVYCSSACQLTMEVDA